MQTACWGMWSSTFFPSQISSSVQAFPSDGDSAQWRKQQGRRERNRGRALFQLKLLLRHQFKKDDVILCSFSKLQYGANKNTNLTLFKTCSTYILLWITKEDFLKDVLEPVTICFINLLYIILIPYDIIYKCICLKFRECKSP